MLFEFKIDFFSTTNRLFGLFKKEKIQCFLRKFRVVLKFFRRRRFFRGARIVKTGNLRDLWQSIADKAFEVCIHEYVYDKGSKF